MEKLKRLDCAKNLNVLGYSAENRPIYGLSLGSGSLKVLAWSQMHGNESTTTKACIDLVAHLKSEQGQELCNKLQIQLIFQLNPDGAERYTRLNANEVDLNRDAVKQSQPEMKVLRRIYADFKPDLCLNLHGQRTIFSAGGTNKPASLSFLAPAAEASRGLTPVRLIAMQLIAQMASEQPKSEAWGIGRYDDAFNLNCTGDYFTAQNTPTILFEAGHYPQDYERLKTRQFVFNALLSCLNSFVNQTFTAFKREDYDAIPNNGNHLRDVQINNVTIVNNTKVTKTTLFVQYKEMLKDGEIHLVPEYAGQDANYVGLAVHDMLEKKQTNPINVVESSLDGVKHLQSLIDF